MHIRTLFNWLSTIFLRSNDPTYTYAFIRTDIDIQHQLCQLGHAAILAGKYLKNPDHSNIVVIKMKNERELQRTCDYLDSIGIEFEGFWEPYNDMGFTSMVTQAIHEEHKELFKQFDLWDGK